MGTPWSRPFETAKHQQAQGDAERAIGHRDKAGNHYEAAIENYLETEQITPSDHQRHHGLLNLHLAECYLALLELKQGEASQLQEGIFASLQSAAAYLDDQPEQARVITMIDKLSKSSWWRELEDT